MKIFNNIDELKAEVVNYVNSNDIKIISVDGNKGSGKSTLARLLCENTGYMRLNLDNKKYRIRTKLTYVDNIKYNTVKKIISENLKKNIVVIIDCVCVQKILENLKIKLELKIYIKRLSSHDHWYDSYYFDYAREVEEIIKENEDYLKLVTQAKAEIEKKQQSKPKHKESLTNEIMRYHHEYKPNKTCDIVYEWFEE